MKKFVVVLSLLAVALAGLAHNAAAGDDRKEPVYKGKPLSEWIEDLVAGADREAAIALSNFGPQAKPAVPVLIALLPRATEITGGGGFVDWRMPAKVLVDIGPVAAPLLLKSFGGGYTGRDAEIIYVLRSMGPEVAPHLVKGFKNANANQRQQLALLLVEFEESREAIPALANKLTSEGSDKHSAKGLSGPSANEDMPGLTKWLSARLALRDVGAEFLVRAAETHWDINRQVEAVMPTLRAALAHQYWGVRAHAAEVLGKMGPDAKEAVPALLRALQDEDPQSGNGYLAVRFKAAEALWKVNRQTERVLPVLLLRLEGQSGADDAQQAANVLELMGPAAKSAIPALIEELRFKPLEPDNWKVRSAAASALGAMGPEAKLAVPALKKALRDRDARVRVASAESLCRLNQHFEEALSVLVETLKGQSAFLRRQSAESLGRIGPAAKAVTPALLATLSAPNEYERVHEAAAKALKKVDPESAKKAGLP